MGAAGRQFVDEQFSWDVVAARMEALYRAVSDRPSMRPRSVGVPMPNSTADREPAGLLCPDCRRRIEPQAPPAAFSCGACGWRGQEADGISILLRDPELSVHDELDHEHGGGHKAAQSAHFDRPGEEDFETDRPHGTPRLYKFLLGEKFRRAVGPIRPFMAGSSALIVCGGSGMDAEYLARIGADVTTSDLSLGAAIRARLRAQRHSFRAASVVADVERLPYQDESFDTVAVHDGLHHLADPFAGLSEMARIARHWVLVSEPAQASVTRFAARFGLALETEAAGNRVARLEVRDVSAFLSARGFVVLRAQRYAMYYPHHPGATFRLLSRPGIFPIVRICWRIANKLVGRFGNKMVVVAERERS